MKRTSLLLGLLVSLCATTAHSQAAPTGKPIEHVAWYRVMYVKFKPGMADEARKIIYEHFWPVDREIGREVIPFDPVTGDWDQVVYFPMPGGPSELGVQSTPWDAKWEAAFERREGGKDKADALNRKYGEMVQQTKIEIVMRRIS